MFAIASRIEESSLLSSPEQSVPFTKKDYALQLSGSAHSAAVVVPLLLSQLSVHSIVDFGSGNGAWLDAFLAAGVSDVQGVEGGDVNESELCIPSSRMIRCNLEQSVDLGRQFDLAMSVEVAEHLPERSAEGFVKTVSSHSDLVLFSAAVPGQGGHHHINEQWPSYWAEKFGQQGMSCYDILRPMIWESSEVSWWYRQNLLLFARGEREAELSRWGASAAPLKLVHPEMFGKLLSERRGVRASASDLSAAIWRRASRALAQR